jgi:hypothetical protein
LTDSPLPIEAAKSVSERYDLDQIILIARDMKTNTVHCVTYGKSNTDAGMAAMDGAKLRAVIAAQPTSLEDAVEAAKLVRPGCVIGVQDGMRYKEGDVVRRQGTSIVFRITHAVPDHGGNGPRYWGVGLDKQSKGASRGAYEDDLILEEEE